MADKKKNLRLNAVSARTELLFHVIIGLFSVCCIIPFVFVIIISFSSEESIRQIGYSFLPSSWSTSAYTYAFDKLPQWTQDQIKKSTQYQKEHVPQSDVSVQAQPAATGGAPF